LSGHVRPGGLHAHRNAEGPTPPMSPGPRGPVGRRYDAGS
jgi:hypothetical protein